MSTSPQSHRKQLITNLLIAAVLIALLLGGLFLYRWYRNQHGGFEDYATSQVAPVGRSSLLWVLRARGQASAGSTLLVLTDRQGRVLREQQGLGRGGRLYAISGDRIFFEDATSGLGLRSASDLSLQVDLRAPVAQQPPLDRGYEVVGNLPSAVVLRGRDQRLYRVDDRGRVGRLELPEGETHHPLPNPLEADRLGVPVGSVGFEPLDPAAPPLRLTELDLVQPVVAMDWEHRAAVTFAAPPAYLVVSLDVVGADASHLLSRVAQPGQIAWTQPVQAMFGEHDLPGRPTFRLIWAEAREGALLAVVEASINRYAEHRGSQRYFARRLVELDPASGQVRARHALARPGE